MIENYDDYKEYLCCDKEALKISSKKKYPLPGGNYCWRYLRLLRKVEYYMNCKKGKFNKTILKILNIKLNKFGVLTGISIPPNTFGKGLGLFHYGSIVVNSSAHFGDWCVIQTNTVISKNVRGGTEVYIAPGVVILDNIQIADHVILGSNSVVTHDIDENGISVAGVPARKISNKGFYYSGKQGLL